MIIITNIICLENIDIYYIVIIFQIGTVRETALKTAFKSFILT